MAAARKAAAMLSLAVALIVLDVTDSAFIPRSASAFAGARARAAGGSGVASALSIAGAATNRPSAAASTLLPLRAASSNEEPSSDLPPIPTEWRGEVLAALSAVIDPDLNRDIVTLGFVKNLELNEPDRVVSFDVELTSPACPVKDQFARECTDLVEALPWTTGADITMTSAPSTIDTESAGLSGVGAVIAVSSCKGGVGKSTTAVNLAYSLQSLGATVGIFDADVYGPSLPTMIEPEDDNVQFVGRQIAPLLRNGVKLMSFGYVNEGSAIMRGPMVTQLLDQFLSIVDWGHLDYLILDMPPGTGDIQLTLTQRLNITAAVIVTTPQELSFADVVRGIEMFDTVNVPCVAVVENMAYYEVEKPASASSSSSAFKLDAARLREAFVEQLEESGVSDGSGRTLEEMADDLVKIVQAQEAEVAKKEGAVAANDASSDDQTETEQVRIFGKGHKQRLSEQWGIEHTFSVPLLERIAANGDSGTPFVLENPDSPQALIYRDLAKSVVREVSKVKYSRINARPSITFDDEKRTIDVDGESVAPAELRRECRCAACVEELTGRQILNPSDVPDSVRPIKMEPCGNYALSVDWSDGHRSLYPYRQIRALLSDGEEAKEEVVL